MPSSTKTADQEKAAEAVKAWETSVKQNATKSVQEKIAERQLLRQHGFTSVKDTGDGSVEEVVEHGQIKAAIFKVVIEAGIVVSKEERDALPVERHSLTGQILDQVPTPRQEDEWEALTPMDRRAWVLAEQAIWKQVQSGPTAILQRWVWEAVERGELPEGTTLVKTKDVVFLTAEPKYIKQNILLPISDAYVLDAEAMGTTFALFGKHNHALKPGARKLLGSATKTAGEKAAAAFVLGSADDDTE